MRIFALVVAAAVTVASVVGGRRTAKADKEEARAVEAKRIALASGRKHAGRVEVPKLPKITRARIRL